ncbi:MAG: hypothetical protein ACOCWL_01210 [Thermoguttaceae bacterium]
MATTKRNTRKASKATETNKTPKATKAVKTTKAAKATKAKKTDRSSAKPPAKDAGTNAKGVRKAESAPSPAGGTRARKQTATIDRRNTGDRREGADRRQKSEPVAVERRSVERRKKVNRRRQIDPTTCERDYTAEEVEFMNALADYKRTSGRMFPTCSEVLEVLRGLGYSKAAGDSEGAATNDIAATAQ